MNINIDLGEILVKAGKIVWKFKILWIFGILAGCGAGSGNRFSTSNYNFGNSGSGSSGNIPSPFRDFNAPRLSEEFRSFLDKYLAYILIIILVLCVLWLLFYFLGVMGKTGLIKGVDKADAGAETLGFGELWTESLPYFWRMFGLTLLVGLPFFIVVVILLVIFFVGLIGFINAANNAQSSAALAGLFAAVGIFVAGMCCISVVSAFVGLIVEQAKNAIVIKDVGIVEGLREGWDVFKRNFLALILLGILLGVAGFIVGIVVAIPLLVIVVPTIFGVALTAGAAPASGAVLVPLILGGICCVIYLPVLWLAGGIEQSYFQSVWTLAYLRITTPKPAEIVTPSVFPNESADAH